MINEQTEVKDRMGVRTDITSRIIKSGFKQRFIMARMTRLPVVGRAMEFALFDKDEMIYLPKDSVVSSTRTRTIDVGAKVEPENTVLPSLVIDHFIRRSRYIFIMDHCMCRESNSCEHYPHDLGCIFLGAGVRKIPPKMGRMASADEAIGHMRKGREKGLVHLIGRNKIDSVWLNTGPKEDLLSICNCCECCCLWRMVPHLSDSIGSGVSRMPGVSVTVSELCTGCGSCVRNQVCFVNAISVQDGKASIAQDLCKGCGRCVEHCPLGVVRMDIGSADFLERSLRAIEPLVDVEKE